MSKMDSPTLTEQEVNDIYTWVDIIPLSRPKIQEEILQMVYQWLKLYIITFLSWLNCITIHKPIQHKQNNTIGAHQIPKCQKLGFQLAQKDIDSVIQVEDRAIERVLKIVQEKQNTSRKMNLNYRKHQLQQSMTNEKDQLIQEQRETIGILELKITKLEQLVKLKDSKIQTLMQKLQQLGYKF